MSRTQDNTPIVLQTGFRIFFLGAVIHTILSMILWFTFYVLGKNIFVAMPLTVWHGHEMVFGFTMAVVAGFLLTAVKNWTGLPTLSGTPLLFLFMLWVVARVLAFMPAFFPVWSLGVANLLFIIFLMIGIMRPIIAVKQWRQSTIFSVILLLLISGGVFYMALERTELVTERKALRFAVYMIINLIFIVGRRILPFFVERGVGYSVTLRNSRVLDVGSLIFMLAFSILDVVGQNKIIILGICAALTIIHVTRLTGWYTPGIWQKPLLWILFIGYTFLIMGFVFKIYSILGDRPDDVALHAWTAGGIGVFTLGMMARVAWGHTGRSIAQPPALVGLMFSVIVSSAIVRVFFPLMAERYYIAWIGISQLLWVLAFCIYLCLYFKVLVSPRPDGKWG